MIDLRQGDCRKVLLDLSENSADSIVCDPPYELTAAKRTRPAPFVEGSPYSRHRVGVNGGNKPVGGFMGKQWDGTGVAFDPATWRAALRVLKPGGHLLAFGGTRTYHRMVCAIEDAGFEVRDQLAWVYGSGFPKSHNGEWGGTALKPAWEPIVLARKPLLGTVEENWREHGTGALNIDVCRIGTESTVREKAAGRGQFPHEDDAWVPKAVTVGSDAGRWPANLMHDGSDEVIALFPQSNGQQGAVTGDEPSSKTNNVYGQFDGRPASVPRGDVGSAARFFYCAKASKRDRNEGCGHLPAKPSGMVSNTSGQHITRRDGGAPGPTPNNHPTVKPTELMRYLCRLITPAGGLVLDPFMGSGSTGKAAVMEGFRFTGIEREEAYMAIARARLDFAVMQALKEELA